MSNLEDQSAPAQRIHGAASGWSRSRLSVLAAIVALVAVSLIAVFTFINRPARVPNAVSSKSACAAARSYAAQQLGQNGYGEVIIDDCASVALSAPSDGTWVATGLAYASQFGGPRTTIAWTAEVEALAWDDPRVCAFGRSAFSNDTRPKALDVAGCKHRALLK